MRVHRGHAHIASTRRVFIDVCVFSASLSSYCEFALMETSSTSKLRKVCPQCTMTVHIRRAVCRFPRVCTSVHLEFYLSCPSFCFTPLSTHYLLSQLPSILLLPICDNVANPNYKSQYVKLFIFAVGDRQGTRC